MGSSSSPLAIIEVSCRHLRGKTERVIKLQRFSWNTLTGAVIQHKQGWPWAAAPVNTHTPDTHLTQVTDSSRKVISGYASELASNLDLTLNPRVKC